MLASQTSGIYRCDGRTYQSATSLYLPSFEQVVEITRTHAHIGNLASDGRPIFGLDFQYLLGAGGCSPCCGEVITVEELLKG